MLDEPTSGLGPLMERQFRAAVGQARERGQTVFLSSHQLAEVDAVCDRVGILRAGRLVEVATIGRLRGLHRSEVSVSYAGAAPDLSTVAGVEAVEDAGAGQLRSTLTGPPGAALRARRRERHCPFRTGTESRKDFPRLLRCGVRQMSTATRPAPAAVASGWAVTGLAVRQVRRGGVIVAVVIAGMTAMVAATYAQVMADSRRPPGVWRRWPGIRLSGCCSASRPDWTRRVVSRCGGSAPSPRCCWRPGRSWRPPGSPGARRDSGRWDVLLAGCVLLRHAVLRHLAAVMMVPAATAVLLAVVLIASGTPASGAVIHAAGTGLLGVVFAAVGSLAAQVFPARSPATGTAFAVLGVTLLLRMIGDGVTAVGWLRWLSPFGLVALSRPYVHDRVFPLLVLAGAAAAFTGLTIAAAGRREVRGGLVAPASGRRARLRLLGSVEMFAVFRVLRPLAGWSIGIGAYYLLIGLTSVSVTGFLTDNPAMADKAAAAGFSELGDIAGLAAVLFAILSLPVGGSTAVRMSAWVAAESDRRLTLLAAQPVSRGRLISAEIVATAVVSRPPGRIGWAPRPHVWTGR